MAVTESHTTTINDSAGSKSGSQSVHSLDERSHHVTNDHGSPSPPTGQSDTLFRHRSR
ncbi:hypothetical protein D9C73_008604 [Collichthys lucidus]|uniref:Uncharacterized protein n=1 Tax=Collichthys lucidus TaxID=240159 RepID=A0A4U5UJV8_COLLU|nr:hypothetical protein D9C73_008604 [Collichthys lucidus]